MSHLLTSKNGLTCVTCKTDPATGGLFCSDPCRRIAYGLPRDA